MQQTAQELALHAPAMASATVDRRAAAAFEATEAAAWADMYAAAPAAFAAAAGVCTCEVGGARVLRWAATGRRYFNRTIGFGVAQPATEAALDAIVEGFERAGIDTFLIASQPHCEPAGFGRSLRDRGLAPFDAHDRIVRGAEPAPAPARPDPHARGFTVERVTPATTAQWADFLERVYRIDTGDWLPELVERPGWHQYVARENGSIAAARCMYIAPDGAAWLGMDGPVPGVHLDDYEPDAALCDFIVRDGLARGARAFVTDIEAPSPAMDTPAYGYFGRLGFRRVYARTHHARLA
jgi:hypothetical protein